MKKICFVTAARSEYGTLKWIMNDIKMSGVFELQLIATGGHLMKEQGHTIDQIIHRVSQRRGRYEHGRIQEDADKLFSLEFHSCDYICRHGDHQYADEDGHESDQHTIAKVTEHVQIPECGYIAINAYRIR